MKRHKLRTVFFTALLLTCITLAAHESIYQFFGGPITCNDTGNGLEEEPFFPHQSDCSTENDSARVATFLTQAVPAAAALGSGTVMLGKAFEKRLKRS